MCQRVSTDNPSQGGRKHIFQDRMAGNALPLFRLATIRELLASGLLFRLLGAPQKNAPEGAFFKSGARLTC
jgi:hypothetical protein